nr:PAS domain S-box protein [Sinorhizobium medicae]
MDLKGVIASWNAGAERLYGHTADEAVGKLVTLLIPENLLGEESELLAQIGAGRHVDHFEKIARDISERRRAQQQRTCSSERWRIG